MGTRTNAAELREIIDTDLERDELDAYIRIANRLVTNTVTCGLDAATLRDIERFIAAHLIAITRERVGIKERLGEAEITYANTTTFGKGLESTHYGQFALTLDTCGSLKNLGKKAVNFKAITSFEE
jgi:hypothetical protein